MTHKVGKVVAPYMYRGWDAEIYGRSDDTGGFYVFLWKDGCADLDFWDVSYDGVCGQLCDCGIEVEWSDM